MAMVQYGEIDYWNKRYENEEDNPFDWLFDYNDLKDIINKLIPNKNQFILLPGCGNASFSPELYYIGGYTNIENIDSSDVVIKQMHQKYPNIKWKVMDVLNLQYSDNTILNIIDKSLIDTLMCYKDGATNTKKMIDELYRVLSPGGIYITFSLHSLNECQPYFYLKKYQWNVHLFRVRSSRWNEKENRRRAIACTMIVCFKALEDGSYNYKLPNDMNGILSDDEFYQLEQMAEEVNFKAALRKASIVDLLGCLNIALSSYISLKRKSNNLKVFQ